MKFFGRRSGKLLLFVVFFIVFSSITLELSLITLERLLLCVACVIVFLSTTLALTGCVNRKYRILNPADQIQLINQIFTVGDLALQYQPIIHQDQKLTSPVPFALKYEAVSRDYEIVIVYRVYWEDEIHPNPLINLFYRFFRIFYYGNAVDSEFIEIWISKVTGDISKIIFETEPNANPEIFLPSHALVKIYQQPNGSYITEFDGKEPKTANPIISERHLRIEVLTWNHEFKLYEGDNFPSYEPQLSLLTDDEYRSEKYARRSAYTYKTREKFLIPILVLEISIIVLVCLFVDQILREFKTLISLLLRK